MVLVDRGRYDVMLLLLLLLLLLNWIRKINDGHTVVG
jgi:hypothetical protein